MIVFFVVLVLAGCRRYIMGAMIGPFAVAAEARRHTVSVSRQNKHLIISRKENILTKTLVKHWSLVSPPATKL